MNEERDETEKEIKWFILSKWLGIDFGMHKHTSIHNLPKGLPDHLRSRKEVKGTNKWSFKRVFNIETNPLWVRSLLNIKKKKEIEDFINWGFQRFSQK